MKLNIFCCEYIRKKTPAYGYIIYTIDTSPNKPATSGDDDRKHYASPVWPYASLRLLASCTQPVWYTALGPNLRRSSADSDDQSPSTCIRACTRRLPARAQPPPAIAAESSAPAQPGLTLHSASCPTHSPRQLSGMHFPFLRIAYTH